MSFERNTIVEKFDATEDFAPWVKRAASEVSRHIGFELDGELHRRFIYDPNKNWRYRFLGIFQGKPALLRIENIKLEIDEENIRQSFRAQCKGSRVRPPETFLSEPFDETKGYAYTVDEYVDAPSLFDPAGSPETAAESFAPFYRELRKTVTKPF